MGATIRDQLLTTLQDTMATLILWTPRVIGGWSFWWWRSS